MRNDKVKRSVLSIIMRVVMLALGIVLLMWTAFLIVYTNFDLGIVLTGMFGVLFAVYGIFFRKINAVTSHGVLRGIKCIIVLGLCVFIAAAVFLAVYGNIDDAGYDEEALIVLGCGVHGDYPSTPLINRLDAAIDYANKNKEALIVVSGGQGFRETVTEASAMEKYLIEKGIEPSRIIKEEKATSTYENMKFSKEILDDMLGENSYRVTVLTNDYHIFRAVYIAKSVGYEATHSHGKTTWYNTVPSYLREVIAITDTVRVVNNIFGSYD